MNWFIEIDKEFFLLINGAHNSFWDFVMWYVSKPVTLLPLYIFLLFMVIKEYKKKFWIVLIAVAILITVTDQVSVQLFKNIFHRLRPSHDPVLAGLVHNIRDYKGGLYGFVSSHAMNYMGIAIFFSVLFWEKIKYFSVYAISIVFVIGYSRIYLGVHYPGDVICGSLAGGLLGYCIGIITKKIVNKYL